jgi:hypothetical protein
MDRAHERRQEQTGKPIQSGRHKRIHERMKPELVACSEAAHKAKDADAGDDPEFDRVVELGSLVECLGGMCGPHLMLLRPSSTGAFIFIPDAVPSAVASGRDGQTRSQG